MGTLLFVLTASALIILTIPLLKKDKYIWWTGGTILVGSLIVAFTGSYYACQDDWPSGSIGKQGACSHHGGVVTKLSEFGWIALITALAIIISSIIYASYKDKKGKLDKK